VIPWRNQAIAETASVATSPAPTGGLNRRDAFSAMPPTDAILLRNWVPYPTSVECRRGWSTRATGLGGAVQTVVTFTQTDGTQRLFAFAAGNMYDVTAQGLTPVTLVTGLRSSAWQHTQVVTEAGTFLYLVNGIDAPIIYDGANITRPAQLATGSGFSNGFDNGFGTGSPFDVIGADPATFINVCLHQRRLWFTVKDSAEAQYLPVDQLGGQLTPFPMGQVFGHGGFLMAQASWSLDAGAGLDDRLVSVSSEGDVAIYSGSDPDSEVTWGLQGVFYVGAPIGRRCFEAFGGDITYICRDGLVPISRYLTSARVDATVALSDKIQQLLSELVSEYSGQFGWETLLFPDANLLFLNMPGPNNSVQYVMCTLNGSWCEFVGMNALSWDLFADFPVFGTRDGRVCNGWEGFLDGVNEFTDYIGVPVDTEVITAFNYFGSPGQPKRWTMLRPIFRAGGIPAEAIGINVDYDVTDNLLPPLGTVTRSQAIWDFDKWDQAKWSAEQSRYQKWQSVAGVGFCAAVTMRMSQATATQWIATDFKFEAGHGL
jgi:hypothetical protein